MSIFKEIKSRLNMKDVAEMYSLKVNRSGFCLCPFHAEKTPSMKIYDDGFKCFGCGEGGDIIKFVEKQFDLSPINAWRKLNDDFGLGIDINGGIDSNTRSEYMLMAERKQKLKDKENCAFGIVSDYLRLLNRYSHEYRPRNLNEIPDKRFMEFLTNYDTASNVFDELSNADSLSFEDKENFYVAYEDTISNIFEMYQTSKEYDKEISEQFSEGKIIGNTLFKDIPDKAYLKYTNAIAPKIAEQLKQTDIKFSGRVYSRLTIFTFDKKDIQKVRDIANRLCNRFARIEKIKSENEQKKAVKHKQERGILNDI